MPLPHNLVTTPFHSPEGGVECLPTCPHTSIADARSSGEGLVVVGGGAHVWSLLLLIDLDLLHLGGHLVHLVLLHSRHVRHAHSGLLLLAVVERIHGVALGRVGRVLRLVLGGVERHDGVFRGLATPSCCRRRCLGLLRLQADAHRRLGLAAAAKEGLVGGRRVDHQRSCRLAARGGGGRTVGGGSRRETGQEIQLRLRGGLLDRFICC